MNKTAPIDKLRMKSSDICTDCGHVESEHLSTADRICQHPDWCRGFNKLNNEPLEITLTDWDIDRLLSGLDELLTDKQHDLHPRIWQRTYDLYQTIGQALGEENIRIRFEIPHKESL
jgi:hypothetical protein